jgi:hypothetical protein
VRRKETITRADLEALSAYLDQALSADETARLETRLRTDAVLRRELRQLGGVRAALRSLPALSPKRDFRLSPSMVGTAPRVRAGFPALSWATGLAVVLCMAVYAWDAIGRSGFVLGAGAPAMPAEEAERAAAPAAGEPQDAGQMMQATLSGTPTPALEMFSLAEDQTPTPTPSPTPTPTTPPLVSPEISPDLVSALKVALPLSILILAGLALWSRRSA